MKFHRLWIGLGIACMVGSSTARLSAAELDDLRNEVKDLKQVVGELKKQVLEMKQQVPPQTAAAPAPSEGVSAGESTAEQFQEMNDKINSVSEAQKKERPGEFNPAIGLVGETIFSYRTANSDETGSDRPGGIDVFQRSVELNLSASVDPFAKGWAVINASADAATGEANLGVEEAALETTSLPWNLTLTAGRFFAEFGRLSYIHDHELPFVNRPLVLDQYIGGESRTDGAQLNWLVPIEHYVSLTLGFGDQFGGDAGPNNPGTYRAFNELNFWSRLSTYFDLTPDWQLEGGVSGLWNPRTNDRGGTIVQPNGVSTLTERERRVAGLDLQLKYAPLQNNQFQSLVWGTELLYSDNRFLFDPDGVTGTGDEYFDRMGSAGLYSYVTYKWSREWSAGFLFDFVEDPQNQSAKTYAYSPYITYALSHWNQLRLQYTHTDPSPETGRRPDDAIYLQWTWIIGAHSHGWIAR